MSKSGGEGPLPLLFLNDPSNRKKVPILSVRFGWRKDCIKYCKNWNLVLQKQQKTAIVELNRRVLIRFGSLKRIQSP
jgi:hypothetical protein